MCDRTVPASYTREPNGAIRRKQAALIDGGRLGRLCPRQPAAGLLRVMRSSRREVYHLPIAGRPRALLFQRARNILSLDLEVYDSVLALWIKSDNRSIEPKENDHVQA